MMLVAELSSVGVCGGVNIGDMLDARSSFNVSSRSGEKSVK